MGKRTKELQRQVDELRVELDELRQLVAAADSTSAAMA